MDSTNDTPPPPRSARVAKLFVILLTLIACQTVVLLWLWRRPTAVVGHHGTQFIPAGNVNIIQQMFPTVNFAAIYPDLSPADIDELQRECFNLRYLYAPFVGIAPMPTSKKFVHVNDVGFRRGQTDQPWPPRKEDLVVFVFGGSTTFGYGLPDDKTVVARLQEELAAAYPQRHVECYNFGRGYFICTQERVLFETLLLSGNVPDVAVFIDGLNEYVYAEGTPNFTRELYGFMAPDLPPPSLPMLTYDLVTQLVIRRVRDNAKMIDAIAAAYHVVPIHVAQPVPFLDFPANAATYPFPTTFSEHHACQREYIHFKEATLRGDFGPHSLWCGDAFRDAASIMYADSIHYSYDGARLLARDIVTKAKQHDLLPAAKTP